MCKFTTFTTGNCRWQWHQELLTKQRETVSVALADHTSSINLLYVILQTLMRSNKDKRPRNSLQFRIIHTNLTRLPWWLKMVKNLPAMLETWVWSVGQEDPLEKGRATHSGVLAWESHGQRSLAGYSPWGPKEPDMTERLTESYCGSKQVYSDSCFYLEFFHSFLPLIHHLVILPILPSFSLSHPHRVQPHRLWRKYLNHMPY